MWWVISFKPCKTRNLTRSILCQPSGLQTFFVNNGKQNNGETKSSTKHQYGKGIKAALVTAGIRSWSKSPTTSSASHSLSGTSGEPWAPGLSVNSLQVDIEVLWLIPSSQSNEVYHECHLISEEMPTGRSEWFVQNHIATGGKARLQIWNCQTPRPSLAMTSPAPTAADF